MPLTDITLIYTPNTVAPTNIGTLCGVSNGKSWPIICLILKCFRLSCIKLYKFQLCVLVIRSPRHGTTYIYMKSLSLNKCSLNL